MSESVCYDCGAPATKRVRQVNSEDPTSVFDQVGCDVCVAEWGGGEITPLGEYFGQFCHVPRFVGAQ